MSRIGKKPIEIPESVEVQINEYTFVAKGPKGEITQNFEPKYITIKLEDGVLTVERKNETKEAKSRHGLYRSLFENAILGVKDGFSKSLEIRGVGYRVAQKGTDLEFNLGYSHSILYKMPEGLTVTFDDQNNNIITISGISKQLVGQTAANIRSLRKPEVYKGKGIRYLGELISLKAGKSASST